MSARTPMNWRERLPILEGRFGYVREVDPSDGPSLFEQITQDPLVGRHISAPPPSLPAFQGFIGWSQRERAQGKSICLAIVPHGYQHAVGLFQIRALEVGFLTSEWGFAIGSSFWSTGVFEDAAAVVAVFVFGVLHAHRLEGRAASANGRGNGALQKMGACGEAVLRRAFKGEGAYQEQFLWSLIAEEWEDRRRGWRPPFAEDAVRAHIEAALASARQPLLARASRPLTVCHSYPFFISGV